LPAASAPPPERGDARFQMVAKRIAEEVRNRVRQRFAGVGERRQRRVAAGSAGIFEGAGAYP